MTASSAVSSNQKGKHQRKHSGSKTLKTYAGKIEVIEDVMNSSTEINPDNSSDNLVVDDDNQNVYKRNKRSKNALNYK